MLKDAWQRFSALSWRWKGSILGVLGVSALLALIIGLAVTIGGGDDTAVLEATQEPTSTVTATAVTPVPTPTPTRTRTPTPTATPTPQPPTPTPTPEPAPLQQQAPALPTAIPVNNLPRFPEGFTYSTETQCQFDDMGRLIGIVTMITIPRAFDPDGDPLTYTWSVNTGSITGSGLTATLSRVIEVPLPGEPIEPQLVPVVEVTVSDGRGGFNPQRYLVFITDECA